MVMITERARGVAGRRGCAVAADPARPVLPGIGDPARLAGWIAGPAAATWGRLWAPG